MLRQSVLQSGSAPAKHNPGQTSSFKFALASDPVKYFYVNNPKPSIHYINAIILAASLYTF